MKKMGLTVEQAREIRQKKGLPETNLERMRVKRGLSQNDLSKLSGVKDRAIKSYEQRERIVDVAKLETLCNLAKALGCSIEDILESAELIEKYKAVK